MDRYNEMSVCLVRKTNGRFKLYAGIDWLAVGADEAVVKSYVVPSRDGSSQPFLAYLTPVEGSSEEAVDPNQPR